jgi:glucosamine--fructose-6-phosphate aminotransferase (isomerizing)
MAEDDATTDPITMLVPAYRMIEQTARAFGLDPDRPPRLSKITETF